MGWGSHRKTNDLGAVQLAAAILISMGYALCALDPAEKKPTYPEWPICLLKPEDFEPGDGLGLMAGPISGIPGHALVFVDLDSAQAVRLADQHLPATAMMEGRRSKPNSHRGYMVPLASIPPEHHSSAEMAASAAVERYGHPGSRILHFANTLDVIGTGGQVACPPTLHASGEYREWAGGSPGEPTVVSYPVLLAAVDSLLAACGHKPKSVTGSTVIVPLLDRDETVFSEMSEPLQKRIVRYLDACPAAVSGTDGHGRTFAVACSLVWGFALDPKIALQFLTEHYNPRCVPAWSTSELRHKIECAAKSLTHRNSRGHLLRTGPRLRLSERSVPFDTTPAEEASKWLR